MSGGQIIRASEVGEYAYCARAWWLHRVEGMRSANVRALARGRELHLTHGRVVRGAARMRRWALLLIGLAMLALVLARLVGGSG